MLARSVGLRRARVMLEQEPEKLRGMIQLVHAFRAQTCVEDLSRGELRPAVHPHVLLAWNRTIAESSTQRKRRQHTDQVSSRGTV
jgi:hypothetical protein